MCEAAMLLYRDNRIMSTPMAQTSTIQVCFFVFLLFLGVFLQFSLEHVWMKQKRYRSNRRTEQQQKTQFNDNLTALCLKIQAI